MTNQSSDPKPICLEDLPTLGLKDTIENLKVLFDGVNGTQCPRCGGSEFWKGGKIKRNGGQILPRLICCDCGYAFTILDINKDTISLNRAARIFNLNDKKADALIDDAMQFGLIKKKDDLYLPSGSDEGDGKTPSFREGMKSSRIVTFLSCFAMVLYTNDVYILYIQGVNENGDHNQVRNETERH